MKVAIVSTSRPETGGAAYVEAVERSLSSEFEVEFLSFAGGESERDSSFETLRSVIRPALRSYDADVLVLDVLSSLLAPARAPGTPGIAIFHHHDASTAVRPLVASLAFRAFLLSAKRRTRVVVVSQFWRRRLSDAGVTNLTVIPNGIDIPTVQLTSLERSAVRKRHGFDARPLVYLGIAHPAKGAKEAYAHLKGLDAQFFTSGRKTVDLPCPHLNLPRTEFLQLLAASDIAVTFSRFDEGWSRATFEAMALGVPIVGSGRGGMSELIQEGHQIEVSEPSLLEPVVKRLIRTTALREALSKRGKELRGRHPEREFAEAWRKLIRESNPVP